MIELNIHKRSGLDRRTLDERREVFSIDYFDAGGMERRKRIERRLSGEKRAGWVRVTQWSSVYVGVTE